MTNDAAVKCDHKILLPIAIKIPPPINSILLPNKLPHLCPMNTPANTTKKVINPIALTTGPIEVFSTANPIPTARASILVATDSVIKVPVSNGLNFFWHSSLCSDS